MAQVPLVIASAPSTSPTKWSFTSTRAAAMKSAGRRSSMRHRGQDQANGRQWPK